MSEIEDILNQLAEGSTQIISSRETVDSLVAKGVKGFEEKQTTVEEYVEKLYSRPKEDAIAAVKKMPQLPDIDNPVMTALYEEVRSCVAFGLNGAAISLSAILLEYALKDSILRKENGKDYKPEDWDKIEKCDFGTVIPRAKSLGLLSDEQEKRLVSFKNQIRNPYLHYNVKKLTKGVVAGKVKEVNIVTGEVKEVDLPSESSPFIWAQAKGYVDSKNLDSVLDFVCESIEWVFPQVPL